MPQLDPAQAATYYLARLPRRSSGQPAAFRFGALDLSGMTLPSSLPYTIARITPRNQIPYGIGPWTIPAGGKFEDTIDLGALTNDDIVLVNIAQLPTAGSSLILDPIAYQYLGTVTYRIRNPTTTDVTIPDLQRGIIQFVVVRKNPGSYLTTVPMTVPGAQPGDLVFASGLLGDGIGVAGAAVTGVDSVSVSLFNLTDTPQMLGAGSLLSVMVLSAG